MREPDLAQKEIIEFSEKRNVGVIAGPGSGKTFTTIQRICHLLKKGVDPKKIMIVTYTNRAILEIQQRINKQFKEKKDFGYSGTLHSICKDFLERELKKQLEELLGFSVEGKLQIIDESEIYRFCTEELKKEINPDNPSFRACSSEEIRKKQDILASELREGISRNKLESYVANKYSLEIKGYEKIYSESKGIREYQSTLDHVYQSYQDFLRDEKKFDHSDLIIYFHYLVHRLDPKEKERLVCSKIDQILVDEFQDMNFLQLQIIREFSGNNKNIFFVGDPNQAIYSFQGAFPAIFNYFHQSDPEAKFFKLTQNYRSTKQIVKLALKLMDSQPQEGILKELSSQKMFTDNEEGEKVSWIVTDRSGGATDEIYLTIKELRSKGVNLNQIAVISRAASDTRRLRNIFWQRGIKNIDFLFSKNVDWPSEYFFLTCFLYWKMKRDPFSLRYMLQYLLNREEANYYLLEDIESLEGDIPQQVEELLSTNFGNRYTSAQDELIIQKLQDLWVELKKEADSFEVPLRELERTTPTKKQFEEFLEEHTTSKVLEFLGDRSKAIKAIVEFQGKLNWSSENSVYYSTSEIFETLLAYIKYLVTHITDRDFLNFSTIHSCKGCEFDYVFVLNLREERFPIRHAKTDEEIAEERRALYVGMTRAKKELYLVSDLYVYKPVWESTSAQKFKTGGTKYSRFLKELGFNEGNPEINYLSNLYKGSIATYRPRS
nr:ATP-dependent helicase [Candidatus Mycoplasma haematolamae]